MVPAAIQRARKIPGLYYVHGNSRGLYIRIDIDGKIEQVNPRTWENDGELDDAGWSDDEATQNARVFRLEEV